MSKFLSNIWTKRIASIISGVYAFFVCYLCYFAIFFDIHVSSKSSLCLLVTGVSIFALVFMLYTRKQIITRIASFIILPAMLPVILLYFGEWELIIPIIATGIIILILSGAGEGTKTALGTISLLLYIFGALGYFLFTSFFVTTAKTQTIEKGVSLSGKYRYTVINTEDSSNGSTAVYVEPNDADIKFPFVTFTLKNVEKIVNLDRPVQEKIKVQWITQTRQEITAALNGISDSIKVHLKESQLKQLGYTYDNKLALTGLSGRQKCSIGKSASYVDTIYLDTLTTEQLALFDIGKSNDGRYYVLNPPAELLTSLKAKNGDIIYFSELSSAWQAEFNVMKDDTVYLNTLTDEQLALLGVPETGDVMLFNDTVCFRYYIAILEEYFDVNDRSLSISLLS